LLRVSALSGGRGAIEPEQAFDAAGLRAGRGRTALAGWFLPAAALLFPVAVALSRVALHGAGSAAVRRATRRMGAAVRSRLPSVPARPGRGPGPEHPERRPGPPPVPAPPAAPTPPPTIDRLLKRKRGED